MIYTHAPYRIEVDVEKTRAFYKDAPLYDCECAGCRNFAQAWKLAPEPVKTFFESFGIDFGKPAEIWAIYSEDKNFLLYGGFFHICGTILQGEKPTSNWAKILHPFHKSYLVPLDTDCSISFSSDIQLLEGDFPSPVIQLDFEITLPWILAEENTYTI